MSVQGATTNEILSTFRTSVDCGLFSTTATTKTTYGPYVMLQIVPSPKRCIAFTRIFRCGGTAAGCATEYECSFTDGGGVVVVLVNDVITKMCSYGNGYCVHYRWLRVLFQLCRTREHH